MIENTDADTLTKRVNRLLASLPDPEREYIEKKFELGYRLVTITERQGETTIRWAKATGWPTGAF